MDGDQTPSAPALRREHRALLATTFANGPMELLDFVVPLWAGTALGASAIEVGVLAAVEMAISVVARPLVGRMTDARERLRIAAAGAALYALSCACYATATNLALACGAAALGGLGGALFFVAVRVIIGERLAEDSAVYPRLMAAEETGAWIAFVAGLWLLALIDYRSVFLLCATACLVAAGVLLSGPATTRHAPRSTADEARPGPGTVGRTLRPMLLAVATTMAAEAAISILLLLHLQRGLGLAVGVIALVFLPGGIATSVLPPYLHRLVLRYGRTRVLAVASVSSAVFAASLGWATDVYVIAGLWIMSGAARAAVVPVQQAVIAEASGGRVGWGMGLYESAELLGGLIGAIAAGALYDGGTWQFACLVAAAVILSGAVIVPRAVRALGVPDVPVETRVPERQQAPEQDARSPVQASPGPEAELTGSARTSRAPMSEAMPPVPSSPTPETALPAQPSRPEGAPAGNTPRQLVRNLVWHATTYVAVQIILAFLGMSWLADAVTERAAARGGISGFAHSVGRIWTIVLAIDMLWTAWKVCVARRER